MERLFFVPTIRRWPSLTDFANDLGITLNGVQTWVRLDSIPGWWFRRVAKAARARGFADVTVEFLAGAAEAREKLTIKPKPGPKPGSQRKAA